MSSDNLPSRMHRTYAWIIQVSKLSQNNENLLPNPKRLSSSFGIWKNLGIFHVKSFVLHSLESDEVKVED